MSTAKSLLIPPLLAALLCLWPAPARPGDPVAPEEGKKEIRLLFAGDILLSRGVEARMARGVQPLIDALYPVFSEADWVVGNLEGAVGVPAACSASTAPSSSSPCFPVRGERVGVLGQLGFQAIGMENNHALDLGPAGRQATRNALVQHGLMPLTLEDSPQFFRFRNVVIGLVTFSAVLDRGEDRGDGTHAVDLRQKLRLARNLANYVVVYVHWGSEFLDWPDEKQRRTASRLIENGADIIVGHHPHVVQKPEVLNGKPVFYSLGNLLFDQKFPATKEGLIADCRIAGGTARCSALATHTSVSTTYPSITGESEGSGGVLAGSAVRARDGLTVNGISLKPENAGAGDGRPGFALIAEKEGKVLWKSPRAKILSIERITLDKEGKAEALFTLETHYSSMDGEVAVRPCVYDVRPEGLVSKWRGTALAWPLKDAVFLPEERILCALHRGDSFVTLQPESRKTRVAAYRWNGFGFSGVHEPALLDRCTECFEY